MAMEVGWLHGGLSSVAAIHLQLDYLSVQGAHPLVLVNVSRGRRPGAETVHFLFSRWKKKKKSLCFFLPFFGFIQSFKLFVTECPQQPHSVSQWLELKDQASEDPLAV